MTERGNGNSHCPFFLAVDSAVSIVASSFEPFRLPAFLPFCIPAFQLRSFQPNSLVYPRPYLVQSQKNLTFLVLI